MTTKIDDSPRTNRTLTSPASGLMLAVAFMAGCGDPISPEQGMFGETGGPVPDVATGLIGDNECLTGGQYGSYGYKYQCDGYFLATVGGVYDDDTPLALYVPSLATTHFGNEHEPYEQAKVIACCGGGYDPELSMNEQPHLAENCFMDFRQQVCRSLAVGLKTLIDDGEVPAIYKPKAIEIQNYLAQNVTECMNGLVDTQSLPQYLQATWTLPNNGPWAPQLQDVYVEIQTAGIHEAYLPEEDFDYCESLHINNAYVFTDESEAPLTGGTWDVLLESGTGSLVGPVYETGRISGSGDFASLATSCMTPFCSTAQLSEDASAGVWAIDDLVLHADGEFTVSNGTVREAISAGRIELYTQSQGVITSGAAGPIYTIPAHSAHFIVVGASGDIAMLPLMNSTEISATQSGGSWFFAPFEIEYTDDLSNTWTLTVGALDWL